MLVRRLSTDWDMTFGRGLANFARDAEATAQAVKTRLQLLRSEWFLDTSAGVPYLQDICVKPSDIPLAESIVKQTILETEGVAEIVDFTSEFHPGTRKFSIFARVRTIYDDISTIRASLL